MFKESEEQWREIKGLENQYAISSKGRVRNLKNGKILGGTYNSHGYKQVDLKGKRHTVHRLVALAFIPNPQNLPEVDHVDERKDNNDVSNLRWVSKSENVRHSAHQQSCRINQLTLDGELVKTWDSIHQIERETGYAQGNIIQYCKGKKRSAYGFKWEYVNPDSQKVYNSPVAALTKDGEFVAKYKSAAEAARFLKISTTQIYFCLKGTYKSTHGLKFVYVD